MQPWPYPIERLLENAPAVEPKKEQRLESSLQRRYVHRCPKALHWLPQSNR
jgi:hypothetical protein